MEDRSELHGIPAGAHAPRVELLRPAELDAEQRALYDRITQGPRRTQKSHVPIADEEDRLLGPFGLMLLAPGVGEAVQELGAALRFRSRMTARARELAILAVAVTVGSGFEWWAHERAAAAAGLTREQLQQLLDRQVPAGLDEQESCVVATAVLLVTGRGLEDAAYRDAESLLGRAGLAELVWLVGYYSTLALALEVFAPPGPGTADAVG
jgi:4-carboxymuconolactone decarboxylase